MRDAESRREIVTIFRAVRARIREYANTSLFLSFAKLLSYLEGTVIVS